MKPLLTLIREFDSLGWKDSYVEPKDNLLVSSIGDIIKDGGVTFHVAPAIYSGMQTEQWGILDKLFKAAAIDLQRSPFTRHENHYEGEGWSLEVASIQPNRSGLASPTYDSTFFPTQLHFKEGQRTYDQNQVSVILHYNATAATLLAESMGQKRGYINALTYARAITVPVKTSPESGRGEVLGDEGRNHLVRALEQESRMLIDRDRRFDDQERGYNQTRFRDVRPEYLSFMPELERLLQAVKESKEKVTRNLSLILETQFS